MSAHFRKNYFMTKLERYFQLIDHMTASVHLCDPETSNISLIESNYSNIKNLPSPS